MDCPNSEQSVPNENIGANNLSANKQNQSQNASISNTMFPKSDDTGVNKSLAFETLKHTIKYLKTSKKNEWPECLCKIWFMTIDIIKQNRNESATAIQLAIKSTLDSMLMTEWHKIDKVPLKNKIIECIPLLQNHPNMMYRCNYIINNMDDPWSNSTFKKIIGHDGNADEIAGTDQQNEEIEFFAIERGCMIEMRAQKLIEIGDCDDIAIKFLNHAIQAIYACGNDHLLRQTVSCRQLQSLLECYLSLLSKTRQMDQLKKELESMSLETIKEFIVNSFLSISEYNRMNQMKNVTATAVEENQSEKKKKKNKKGKRTWTEILLEHHISVSKFAVQFVLVRILKDEYKSDGNIDSILEKLLGIWIEQNRSESNFEELFTKLVKNTTDNRKIYECCESFHRLFPDDCGVALQVFCKTLTLEINELEEKKFDLSAEASTLLNFEKQISDRYLFLHNILYSYTEKRECVLTAFSMNPTQSNFELVCEYSKETGSNDQKAMPHLSDSLKSDLGCLLSQPRIKKLCWSSPWPELNEECQKLMQTENKIKILENSTATANDNLKYLDLNYDDFVDFKPHKYPGIEDGYDIYVLDSDSDSKINALERDSDGTDTAPESKDYILEEKKEAQRMRNRKRNLIRRSQKQLADPGGSDRHRQRKYAVNDLIDGLKIKRFPRKNIHKKTIKPEPDANQTLDSSKETITLLPDEGQSDQDANQTLDPSKETIILLPDEGKSDPDANQTLDPPKETIILRPDEGHSDLDADQTLDPPKETIILLPDEGQPDLDADQTLDPPKETIILLPDEGQPNLDADQTLDPPKETIILLPDEGQLDLDANQTLDPSKEIIILRPDEGQPDLDANQTLDPSKETVILLPDEGQQIDDEQILTNETISENVLLTKLKIEPMEEKMETDENGISSYDETIPEIKYAMEDIDVKTESDVKMEIDPEYDDASIQTIIFGNEINETMENDPTENQTINEENNTTEHSNTSLLIIENVQDSQVQLKPDSNLITNTNTDTNKNTNNHQMAVEQIPKPKNPLLSFRRPKKQTKFESIQYDGETIRHSTDLIPVSTLSDCISHYSDCSTNGNESEIPCEMEMDNFRNHRTEYCLQDTTKIPPNVDTSEDETKADIVILTKHCTVRLQRIPDHMLEDFQYHSSESDENIENLETPNDAQFCENDTNTNDANMETNGIQESLAECNEGDVEVNSNIMYDCKYQSTDDFNDSSLNSLSNQSSTVLNGYENECNGKEKLQEIHEAMTKVDEQSKPSDEMDQFQSPLSMSDTQQQCMKHVQFHCMSIRVNYSNHLSSMYPLSTYLERCQTFTKKSLGLEVLHQKKNEKIRYQPSSSIIRLCTNNYCEWFLLKLPLPVTHINIVYDKNSQGKILFWERSTDSINEHRSLNESSRFISNIQILILRRKYIKICVTILFGIAVRIWYSKFSFVKRPAKRRRQLFSDIFVFVCVFIVDFIWKICLVCGVLLIVNLMMKTFKKSTKNGMFDARPKIHCVKNRLKCWNKNYSTLISEPSVQYYNSDVRKSDYGLSFSHRCESSKFQWPIKSIIVVRMVQVLFTNDKHVQNGTDDDNPEQSNPRTTTQQTGVSIISTTRNNNFESNEKITAKADPIIEMTGNASDANEFVEQNGNNDINKSISKSSASRSNRLFYMLNSPPKPITSQFLRKINSKIMDNETVSNAPFLLKNGGTDSSVVHLKNGIRNPMNGTVIRRITDAKFSSTASTASAAIVKNVSKTLAKSGSSPTNGLIKFQSIGLNGIPSSTYTINQINQNDNNRKVELNSNQHILLNGVCTQTLQTKNVPKYGFRIQMKNRSNDLGHTTPKIQMNETKCTPTIVSEKQSIHLKSIATGMSGRHFAVTSSPGTKNTMLIIETKSKEICTTAKTSSTNTQKGQLSIKSIRNNANVKFPVLTLTSRDASLSDNRQTFALNKINDKSQAKLNISNRVAIPNMSAASQSLAERLKKNSFLLAQNVRPQQKDLANQLHEFDIVMEQIKEQSSINLPNNDNMSIIMAKQQNPKHSSEINGKICDTNTTELTRAINMAILKKKISAEEASETSESQDTISDKTEHETIEFEDNLSNSNDENQRDRQSRLFSPKQIHKLHEDEKTTKRIHDILAKYAEQMSSSPDLRNKPAPRRRSNLIHVQSFATTATTTTTTISPNTDFISRTTIPNASNHNESPHINVIPLSNSEDFCDATEPSASVPKKRKKSLPNSMTKKILKCDAKDVEFIPLQQTSHNPTVSTSVNESPLTMSTHTVKLPLSQSDCLTVKESLPNNRKKSLTKISDHSLAMENSKPCTTAILLSGNYFLPMGIVNYASEPSDIAKNQCRQKLFQLKKNPVKSAVNDAKNCDRSTIFSAKTHIKKEMSAGHTGLSANERPKTETMNGLTKATTLKLVSIKSPPTMSTILMNTLVQSNIQSKNSKAQLHGNAHLQSSIMRPNGGILLFDSSYASLIAEKSSVLETAVPKQINGDCWTSLKSISDSVQSEEQNHEGNGTNNHRLIKSADYSKINVCPKANVSNNEYFNRDSTHDIKHMFRDDEPLSLLTDDCDILNDIELSIMESRHNNSIDENWLKIKSNYDDYGEHYDQSVKKLMAESTKETILVDADNLSASFESETKDPNTRMTPSLIDVQKSDRFTLNSMLTNSHQISSSKLIFRRESIFQQSLSEECGDLGVDEPCTSELFPEAFMI